MASPSRTRIVAAGTIGNVLEWYDFAIYGYFAPSIGRAFFPVEDPVAQVLVAFGVFAVGYLMRPLAAAWLVRRTDMDLSPAFMVLGAALVTGVALLSFAPSRHSAAAAR